MILLVVYKGDRTDSRTKGLTSKCCLETPFACTMDVSSRQEFSIIDLKIVDWTGMITTPTYSQFH